MDALATFNPLLIAVIAILLWMILLHQKESGQLLRDLKAAHSSKHRGHSGQSILAAEIEPQMRSRMEEYNRALQEIREERKNQVLHLFQSHEDRLTNAHVEDALGLSPRSAIRYLRELERNGKIKQVHTYGRFVVYQKQ